MMPDPIEQPPERAPVIAIGQAATLPAPLVPAEVDLRGYPSFLFDVDRFLASETVALASPEEIAAAVMLWARAWKQQPAASLPDDDRVLASFSGAGKRWAKIKKVAMRGFVRCSDGRLYHRVLAEQAIRAWQQKTHVTRRRERDAERLRNWRQNRDETHRETRFETDHETPVETPYVARFVAAGEERRGEESKELPQRERVGERGPGENPLPSPSAPARPPQPGGKRQLGSRLPNPWQLPDEWREWACRTFRIDPQQAVRISHPFRDHWWAKTGQDATKADWFATWRNWVRRELRERPHA